MKFKKQFILFIFIFFLFNINKSFAYTDTEQSCINDALSRNAGQNYVFSVGKDNNFYVVTYYAKFIPVTNFYYNSVSSMFQFRDNTDSQRITYIHYYQNGNYVNSSSTEYTSLVYQLLNDDTANRYSDYDLCDSDGNVFFPLPPVVEPPPTIMETTLEEVQTIVLAQMKTITIIAIGILALLIGLKVLLKVLRRFSRS